MTYEHHGAALTGYEYDRQPISREPLCQAMRMMVTWSGHECSVWGFGVRFGGFGFGLHLVIRVRVKARGLRT